MASTQKYYAREGDTVASIYRSVWRQVAYASYSDFSTALKAANPTINFSTSIPVGTVIYVPYAKS